MWVDAGIEGYFTNHSGKMIFVTSLYQADVPKQEIINRTRHRSIESFRKYKRASTEMLQDISIDWCLMPTLLAVFQLYQNVSNILDPGSSKKQKESKRKTRNPCTKWS